jgi:hypothetical protein
MSLSNSYAISDTYRANGAQHPYVNSATRRRPSTAHTNPPIARSIPMLDVVMIALALVFFALSVGYTIACDRL